MHAYRVRCTSNLECSAVWYVHARATVSPRELRPGLVRGGQDIWPFYTSLLVQNLDESLDRRAIVGQFCSSPAKPQLLKPEEGPIVVRSPSGVLQTPANPHAGHGLRTEYSCLAHADDWPLAR